MGGAVERRGTGHVCAHARAAWRRPDDGNPPPRPRASCMHIENHSNKAVQRHSKSWSAERETLQPCRAQVGAGPWQSGVSHVPFRECPVGGCDRAQTDMLQVIIRLRFDAHCSRDFEREWDRAAGPCCRLRAGTDLRPQVQGAQEGRCGRAATVSDRDSGEGLWMRGTPGPVPRWGLAHGTGPGGALPWLQALLVGGGFLRRPAVQGHGSPAPHVVWA